ncbi:N-acetylneuraminate synthase family protein [Candidatus Pelagibacter sp.]|nr:N-acetylneuraminate synthase family protein [Candidatus Pelagibacter sp.]
MKKNKINFIAEISSNHNKSLKRTFSLIDSAKKNGFNSVKFQLFKINELFSQEILENSYEHRKRTKWELPLDFIPKISKYCKQKKIKFGCTPFYLEGVNFLKDYVDFFKISSYELLWDKLLIECSKTNKPIIISTGMATLNEVSKAVKILKKTGNKKITVMHCVSAYPADYKFANLSVIEKLRKKLKVNIGWSDHTVNSNVIMRAIYKWNVKDIELHYDLEDKKGFEFKGGHCWLPHNAFEMISNINEGIFSDGKDTKKPTASELNDRNWRTDPIDGLRPFIKIRKKWSKKKY